jgi:flavin-binding protein dodecin
VGQNGELRPPSGFAEQQFLMRRRLPRSRGRRTVPAHLNLLPSERRRTAVSVYRVTEVIGTSATSWEDAAKQAISTASRSLRDLRIAEVVQQDVTVGQDGGIEAFRTKLKLSFKFEAPWDQPGKGEREAVATHAE